MKKKIENLQAFRGIAALGVVLLHTSGRLSETHGIELFPSLFDYGKYGVDLFFIISGFIMVIITRDKFNDSRKIAGFLYCRISRIYPPYWFYVLLVGLAMWIMPGVFAPREVSFLKSFLLLPQRELPVVVVGWTLIYEVYFYIVFGVILVFPREKLPAALATWSVVLLAGNYVTTGVQESIPAAVSIVISPFSLEFIYGCLAALLLSHRQNRIPGFRPAFVAVALVTVLGQFAENSTTEFWRRLLYIGIPAAGLIYTGVWLEEKGRMRFSRPFRFIGDISYSLYLSHVFTLAVFARIIVLFLPNLDAALLVPVFLILAPVLTIAVGYASYRLVELPLVHLCRISIPSVFRVGEQINT